MSQPTVKYGRVDAIAAFKDFKGLALSFICPGPCGLHQTPIVPFIGTLDEVRTGFNPPNPDRQGCRCEVVVLAWRHTSQDDLDEDFRDHEEEIQERMQQS